MENVWSTAVKINYPFQQIVNTLTSPHLGDNGLWPGTKPYTEENLREFEKQYTLDCLKGLRYGQSFCHFFGIPNATPLYHFKDTTIAMQWIKYNYLEK